VRGFPVETSELGCPKNLQSIFGAVKRCFDFNATGIPESTPMSFIAILGTPTWEES
jgi:hypothetical protein